jgi:hypothetical protein
MRQIMSGDMIRKDSPTVTIEQSETQFLTSHQVAMIDEALGSLGDYGELRLVVEKGRLRFVVTHKSFDALKWTPGMIIGKPR